MTMPAGLDAIVDEAVALFYATFHAGVDGDDLPPRSALTIAAAPGRVNLIGEHTDYNDGFVLPLALDRYTVVVGLGLSSASSSSTSPLTSKVASTLFPGDVVTFAADRSLRPPPPHDPTAARERTQTWAHYVQGVTAMYLERTPTRAGLPVRAAIASSVPLGSGLSSSAAVEVAFATFLEAAFAIEGVGLTDKALLCQRAEHAYCHVPCGIMDQFISTCGQRGAALLLDCRSKVATPVPFADPDVVLVVSNSNAQHELCGTEYSDRVRQCQEAVAGLQRVPGLAGITHLRDVTMDDLEAVRATLPAVVFARARHVITENARTTETAELIRAHRYADAGRLMYASHESLRVDYEVSTPQLDALVEMARAAPGVYGARMTGGGFGGCIVVMVQRQHAPELLQRLDAGYPTTIFGEHAFPKPTSFVTTIGAGAFVLQRPSHHQ